MKSSLSDDSQERNDNKIKNIKEQHNDVRAQRDLS